MEKQDLQKPLSDDQEEAVPFDDCLRLLVNTPPKPKKAQRNSEDQTPPEDQAGKDVT